MPSMSSQALVASVNSVNNALPARWPRCTAIRPASLTATIAFEEAAFPQADVLKFASVATKNHIKIVISSVKNSNVTLEIQPNTKRK